MPASRANRMTWVGAGIGLILLLVAVVIGVSWRGERSAPASSPQVSLSHIHGMAVNPADGLLYVATHHGVVRVSNTEATAVGDSRQDTMGFTVVGPNHFIASGHPAPGESGPGQLGLIESTDAGRTWRVVSLTGQADFHALRSVGGVTYGLDSGTSSLLASQDRLNWEARSRIEAHDLAVDPQRTDTMLASTQQGLQRSTDGGRTWRPSAGPIVLLLDWPARDRLNAIDVDGRILRSSDGGATWSPTAGSTPGAPAAFATHGEVLYVATLDGQVLRSNDAGATWEPMLTSQS
ncbi:F510_1955 family glycosylhydrolase [Micromonospora aurantiaca (nom. illeg.)]|uniref:F510_1955 family glycosylhydrolase n=1 Tax=Micromonospora aurantiaca (nom. illeg.) TaxID=47850 RepID=UPI001656A72B|nr:exo-alpha-sialidase [Micromonospora aurantiaca]MBC9003022.1 exo-alpha-sialidase [Micromonospora aurantiaca]